MIIKVELALMIGLLLGCLFMWNQVVNVVRENEQKQYDRGYRAGLQHAYDNVVICGASPEEEGIRINDLRTVLGENTEAILSCGDSL